MRAKTTAELNWPPSRYPTPRHTRWSHPCIGSSSEVHTIAAMPASDVMPIAWSCQGFEMYEQVSPQGFEADGWACSPGPQTSCQRGSEDPPAIEPLPNRRRERMRPKATIGSSTIRAWLVLEKLAHEAAWPQCTPHPPYVPSP